MVRGRTNLARGLAAGGLGLALMAATVGTAVAAPSVTPAQQCSAARSALISASTNVRLLFTNPRAYAAATAAAASAEKKACAAPTGGTGSGGTGTGGTATKPPTTTTTPPPIIITPPTTTTTPPTTTTGSTPNHYSLTRSITVQPGQGGDFTVSCTGPIDSPYAEDTQDYSNITQYGVGADAANGTPGSVTERYFDGYGGNPATITTTVYCETGYSGGLTSSRETSPSEPPFSSGLPLDEGPFGPPAPPTVG
jgi:hypothetical protein